LLGIAPTGLADSYGFITTGGAALGAVYLSPALFPYPTKNVHVWFQCQGTHGSFSWSLFDIANGATICASGGAPFSTTAITLSVGAVTLTGTGQYQFQIATSGDTEVRIYSANFVNAP
jgi:hypothetical protein